ncbi:MAG: hypothetical protein Q9217_006501 [Psora testacea]
MSSNWSSKRDDPRHSSRTDSAARQRGRPRIDRRDQSAAERRRTQIRLAQRAYRERKDMTISLLTRKVAAFEAAMNQMNQAFHNFERSATKSGSLEAGVAQELRRTSDCFAELAGEAVHGPFEPDDIGQATGLDASILDSREASHIPRRRPPQSMVPEPAPLLASEIDVSSADRVAGETDNAESNQSYDSPMFQWDKAESLQGVPPHMPTYMVPSELELLNLQLPETAKETRSQELLQHPSFDVEQLQENALAPQSWQHGSPHYRVEIPDFPATSVMLPDELPLPMSHSYSETSFTRRLMRAAFETAYQLMIRPYPNPTDLDCLVTFGLCFFRYSAMVDNFEHFTKRAATESLEQWQAPLLHVGGAGLHYPRGGIDASSKPPEWWANQAPPGPPRPQDTEKRLPDNMSDREKVDYAGVGGEWFDSNDVEQYLRTKGLQLDSHSTIVELPEPEIPDADSMPPLSSATTASVYGSGVDSQSPHLIHPLVQPNAPLHELPQTSWIQASDGAPQLNDMGTDPANSFFLNAKGFDASLDFSIFSTFSPSIPFKPKKILDVDLFVESKTIHMRSLYKC